MCLRVYVPHPIPMHIKAGFIWAAIGWCCWLSVALALDSNELEPPLTQHTTDSSSGGSSSGGSGGGAREAREYTYSSYFPDDDKAKYPAAYSDYPPSNYLAYKEEAAGGNCPPCGGGLVGPVLTQGLNLLVLKLGAIGLVKAFVSVLFFVFLLKLPLLLAKAAFLKAIVLPAFIAPLMMLFSNSNMMNNMMMMMNKPAGGGAGGAGAGGAGGGDSGSGSGRALEQLTDGVWNSWRMVLESDKCAERMACHLGVYTNHTLAPHTIAPDTLSRMVSGMESEWATEAGSRTRFRLRSLRTAFVDGSRGGECGEQMYPCSSPHLILAHGHSRYTLL